MTSTAAGWHPAPDGQPYLRYWDGAAWTEHTAPLTQPIAQQPTQMVTRQPVKTSHTFHLIMSILTCGVWAVFVWLPIGVLNSMRREKVVTKLQY